MADEGRDLLVHQELGLRQPRGHQEVLAQRLHAARRQELLLVLPEGPDHAPLARGPQRLADHGQLLLREGRHRAHRDVHHRPRPLEELHQVLGQRVGLGLVGDDADRAHQGRQRDLRGVHGCGLRLRGLVLKRRFRLAHGAVSLHGRGALHDLEQRSQLGRHEAMDQGRPDVLEDECAQDGHGRREDDGYGPKTLPELAVFRRRGQRWPVTHAGHVQDDAAHGQFPTHELLDARDGVLRDAAVGDAHERAILVLRGPIALRLQ
mmetsp:Transcript_77750/g.240900  ORF Transcript_77750/g.240900 Transcript_77750/m.240900 type:complete len:263 (-) Transcript_77750:765-1553(-)